MLIAILDERVDVGKRHLIGTGRHAGDRLERGRRLVHGDVETLALEVPSVLGKEKGRGQSFEAAIEREPDAGLRRRRGSRQQYDRRREDVGGPSYPREVQEAHDGELWQALVQ